MMGDTMDVQANLKSAADELVGRRLLILVPNSRKEITQYLQVVFKAAKARWNWQISMIGDNVDQKPFDKLIFPEGKFYPKANLLQIADWERDPAAVTKTDKRIHEAEVALRRPAGRNILAAAHSLGRAYSVPLIYPKVSKAMTRLLTDNSQANAIFRRIFHFTDEVLDAANPDFVFIFERVTPFSNVICAAAESRGIPCFVHRRSKIRADYGFWTTDSIMLNTVAFEGAKEKRRNKTPVSDAAKAQIAAFRDRPKIIKYIALRWRDKAQMNFVRWLRNYARTVVREFINTFRGQDRSAREPNWARVWRYYRGLFLSYYQQRVFVSFDEEALAKMKYVYFPMHKEAELAQTFQAPLWHDQRNTIRVLATLLPFGYRLLVREHRLNYGRRPTRYYRELHDMPNVSVIDPFDSQFKYITNASLVVTENGSTGWEALLFGKRLLALSHNFYDGAELGMKVMDPDRLNAAILELLSKPAVVDQQAHDYALGCMIDAETETTFSMAAESTPAALDHLANLLRPLLRHRANSERSAERVSKADVDVRSVAAHRAGATTS
jgi:hypothetical protein